jgi:LuxR family maltose regulon positive regulatory protein
MPTPVLATKLFVPARRPQLVVRPRLIQRSEVALVPGHKLTLVSAPAGFGKTKQAATAPSESPAGMEVGPRRNKDN